MPRWSRDVLDAPHTVREFEQLDFEMYEHVRFYHAAEAPGTLTGFPLRHDNPPIRSEIVDESLKGSQTGSTELA